MGFFDVVNMNFLCQWNRYCYHDWTSNFW